MKKNEAIGGLIAGVFLIMLAPLFIATANIFNAVAAGAFAWFFGTLGGIMAGISYFALKSPTRTGKP
jgi:hypothetical protein